MFTSAASASSRFASGSCSSTSPCRSSCRRRGSSARRGCGMLMWPSSTPLLVMTNSVSPTISGEQVGRLCGKTPSSLDHVQPPDDVGVGLALVLLVRARPCCRRPGHRCVAQTTSQRLLTYQRRSPSTTGLEQMPSSGQSLTRPAASLSWTLPEELAVGLVEAHQDALVALDRPGRAACRCWCRRRSCRRR